MAPPVLNLVCPGGGSPVEVLGAISAIWNDMKESQAPCQRTYDRLDRIYAELIKIGKVKQLPPRDALDEYGATLARYSTFLKPYRGRALWYRLLQHKTMMNELKDINTGIDTLLDRLRLSAIAGLINWKSHWEQDQAEAEHALNEAASNSDAVLSEAGTREQMLEAVTVLDHALNSKDLEPEWLEPTQSMLDTIVKATGMNVVSAPPWFLPLHKVPFDPEPFAKGETAAVHRGSWMGNPVVVKALLLHEIPDPNAVKTRLIDEADVWFKLRHKNVIRMHGASHVTKPPYIVWEDASNGNLSDYFRKSPDARKCMWQLLCGAACGLEYIHSQSVVHGNVKLNNILVGSDGDARIADFGLNFVNDLRGVSDASTVGGGGRVRWRAPECLTTRPTFAGDVYSLGMCIIEAVSGQLPYTADNSCMSERDVLIAKGKGEIPDRPDGMSDAAWTLVVAMTAKDPSDRCSLEDAICDIRALIDSQDPSAPPDVAMLVNRTLDVSSTARTKKGGVDAAGVVIALAPEVRLPPLKQPDGKVRPVGAGASSPEQDKAMNQTAHRGVKTWIIIVVLLLFVCAITAAIAVPLLLRKKSSSSASTVPTPVPTDPPSPITIPVAGAVEPYTAVTVSTDGYIYVASDRAVYRMLLSLGSGSLQLYAGSATEYGIDNGDGAAARFFNIVGLAAPAGKLYVAEKNSFAVRAVDSSGTASVAIVAGTGTIGDVDGPLSSAKFGSISSMGIDTTLGDVFVADYSRGKILGVSFSKSTVSTVARVSRPSAIAMRTSGEMYFASECAIFRISSAGVSESLLAGSRTECRYVDQVTGSASRFSSISSLALSPSGNVLYIADRDNHCIRKMIISSARVKRVAGVCGTIDTDASLPTSSGSSVPISTAMFAYPAGLEFGPSGLYVVDNVPGVLKGRLRRLDITSVSTVATLARGLAPLTALAADSSDQVVAASDSAVYRQRLDDLTTQGMVLVAGSATDSGTVNGQGTAARFDSILGLAARGSSIYIAERYSFAVRVFQSDGTVSNVAGSGTSDYVDGPFTSARLGTVTSIAAGGNLGDVFVADYSRDQIRRLSFSQSTVSSFAGHRVAGMTAIAVRPSGELYFASECAVFLISSSGASELLVAGAKNECRYENAATGSASRFSSISSLALAPSDGHLYIADRDSHCIRKMNTATNEVTTVAGVCGSSGSVDGVATSTARLELPSGLSFTSSGDLLFIDGPSTSRNIRRVDLSS